MAFEQISPNMLLPVPGVGTTSGPQYATDINSCLTLVDGHNHTSGSGVQVPSAGININTDLSFNALNAIALNSARFSILNSAIASSSPNIGCAYAVGASTAELYWNDAAGNQVQITKNGSVNVSGQIGFTGLPSGTASASFSANTFIFQSATNIAAYIDAGAFYMRNFSPNSTYYTLLAPPASMAANQTITLPAVPAVTSFLTMDNSGNIGTSLPTALGINTANIANSAVTTAKIAALNVTTATIAAGAVTNTKITSSAVVSSSSGSFNTNALSTITDVTGLSVTINCSGTRPVMIMLQPDGNASGSISTVGFNNTVASPTTQYYNEYNFNVFLFLVKDSGSPLAFGSVIATNTINSAYITNVYQAVSNLITPSSAYIDPSPTAGNHTYKVQIENVMSAISTGSFALVVKGQVTNAQLVAYEL